MQISLSAGGVIYLKSNRTANLAYNLTKYESRQYSAVNNSRPQRVYKPKSPLRKVNNAKRKRKLQEIQKRRNRLLLRAKIAGIAVLFLVLISMTIYSRIILSEAVFDIWEYKNVLSELKSDGIRLTNEVEQKNSSNKIEIIAKNELGLVPIENHQKFYINEDVGDRVDFAIEEENSNIFESIKNFFSRNTNTDSMD